MTQFSEAVPELDAAIDEVVQARVGPMHTAIVARVEAYDDATQTVSARPVVRDRFVDNDGEVWTTAPSIANVPIAYPTGGDYSITWPLAVGDYVLLVFGHRSLAEWKVNAQVDYEPVDRKRFWISDAVAVPGVLPPGAPRPSAAYADAMVFRGDEFRFGDASVSTYLARADFVNEEIGNLRSVISAMITAFSGLSVTIPPPPPQISASCVKVKGE